MGYNSENSGPTLEIRRGNQDAHGAPTIDTHSYQIQLSQIPPLNSNRSEMSKNRRVQIDETQPPKYDDDDNKIRLRQSGSNVSDDQEPFMGVKVRRKASLHRDYKGDYIDVPSHPSLLKILQKQGDKKVLFADKVLKFTGSGKMKRRTLLITDFAIYIIDPETDGLKRRIALAAVEKICLSELSDNFYAIIIPTEYDLLMASTRKSEIVTVLVEATKSQSDYELEVLFSNCFEYHAASEFVKEVQFEEVEGGVKTRIVRK